jgi:NAD(P)-dependent dehydrogenase (short-subunit alcohol dehydrogenase family)
MDTYAPCLDYMSSYTGKHVIVTGASGAVGYQIVESLIKVGAKSLLLIANNHMEDLEVKVQRLRLQTANTVSKVNFLQVDFNDPRTIADLVLESFKSKLDARVDALFCCHGVLPEVNCENASMPEVDKTLKINVRSVLHIVSLIFPFMKE